MKRISLVIAAAASMLSFNALAQGYVSAAVGPSDADIDCTGAATCDKTSTAVKLVGGYRFGSNFSGELGYMDLGKATASGSGISVEMKASALMLGVAYQAQLSPTWGANFRLGVASVKTRISGTVSGLGSASDSETNTVPYVGVGVNYAVSKNVKLEFGADFTRAEYDGEKSDVRAVTFGVRYDF